MTREYEVRVTPTAMNQIVEATRYVRDDLGMPQAANALLERLETGIASLSRMPLRFRKVNVEPLLSAGARRMNVGKYAVYYTVNDNSMIVNVFAVLYGTPTTKRLVRAFGTSGQTHANGTE